MVISFLEMGGLYGFVWYHWGSDSYHVEIELGDQTLLKEVFGNGVTAESRLLDLLEFPEWTILKHA